VNQTMKKYRILASVILTAGLGLSGVTAASASGGGPTQPAPGKEQGQKVCIILQEGGKPGSKQEKSTAKVVNGKVHVGGKQVTKQRVKVMKCAAEPALPVPGQGRPACVIVTHIGKPTGKPEKSAAKVVNGKAYVGGKQVPKQPVAVSKCPAKPTLPAPGKGGTTGRSTTHTGSSSGAAVIGSTASGRTTARS
jgi:hypothetical protein